mmetsp:Transcript_28138/g.56722  ORF Transcript_28138/g.56722 Transcript_28138/m.56722 type:complete len:151 (-) Transcript_28138:427-879(-)
MYASLSSPHTAHRSQERAAAAVQRKATATAEVISEGLLSDGCHTARFCSPPPTPPSLAATEATPPARLELGGRSEVRRAALLGELVEPGNGRAGDLIVRLSEADVQRAQLEKELRGGARGQGGRERVALQHTLEAKHLVSEQQHTEGQLT